LRARARDHVDHDIGREGSEFMLVDDEAMPVAAQALHARGEARSARPAVEDRHGVSRVVQQRDHNPADEASAADHENSHGLACTISAGASDRNRCVT
jgi:hypothetical protein